MASLLSMGMPRPRGSGAYEDTLLGIEPTVGMTDRGFRQMGRAPVDELFAGRNSAWIDDAKWDELELQARDALTRARVNRNKDNRPNAMTRIAENMEAQNQAGGALPINQLPHNSNTSYIDDTEGGDDDMAIRRAVTDATGLHLYPGQGVNGSVGDSIFMYEFDDSGATLRDGWRIPGAMPKNLGSLLDHPELYEHYPELRGMSLEISDLGPSLLGSYGGIGDSDNGIGGMQLNSRQSDKDILDTILHETQHYIQRIEDWPGGGAHGEHTTDNYAAHQNDRVQDYVNYASAFPEEVDEAYDNLTHEAYQNIDGEILARDVEKRFNARNAVNNAVEMAADPNSEYHTMSDEERKNFENAVNYTAGRLNYYPAAVRDSSNSYPHTMPVGNPAINPYVRKNAMAIRHDSWGYDDDDTISSFWDANSLLEEALKNSSK